MPYSPLVWCVCVFPLAQILQQPWQRDPGLPHTGLLPTGPNTNIPVSAFYWISAPLTHLHTSSYLDNVFILASIALCLITILVRHAPISRVAPDRRWSTGGDRQVLTFSVGGSISNLLEGVQETTQGRDSVPEVKVDYCRYFDTELCTSKGFHCCLCSLSLLSM